MKKSFGGHAVAFGALAVALSFVPDCAAQCGGANRAGATKSSWLSRSEIRFLPVAFQGADEQDLRDGRGPSIVGFWHQQLISEGSMHIPDGTVIDDDLAQWHSDNTEIQNTKSRPAISGNFCLGVWEQTGPRKFKLNHFPQAFDPTGTVYVGTAQLQEEITVSSDGTRYSGTFTLDQYDLTGKTVLVHVQGKVTGTRITAKSTIAEVL